MTDGSAVDQAAGSKRKTLTQIVLSAIIVIAVACLFFVFYVSPQSQHERDRIYRSMIQVSRLIDDRTMAADQALHSWSSEEKKSAPEISGFAFNCDGKNIICLTHGTGGEASFTLQALAESAQLPYPEAILLITDSEGNVVAGHDTDGKWLQFQSLAALIDTRNPAVAAQAQQDQATALLRSAQRMGRGEQNSIFEGYPARLSRDIGGQSYAVFVASHQIGRSLQTDPDKNSGFFATVQTRPDDDAGKGADGKDDAGTPGGTEAEGQGNKDSARQKDPTQQSKPRDQLFFAYLIPERVIDRAALQLPSQWTINVLILLVGGLLAIPFLKLFNQNPLKPIRLMDLAALLIAIMLIVTTATLFVSAMLLRNSIAQDIRSELSVISDRVAQTVANGLEAPVRTSMQGPGARVKASEYGHLQSVFRMDPGGVCQTPAGDLSCGQGIWFTEKPAAADLDVRDRAYFRAWKDCLSADTLHDADGNAVTVGYAQFVRSKSDGTLSWSRIQSVPGSEPGNTPDCPSPEAPFYVVSAMPLGLRAPVLPRNYEFMIVLNTDLPPSLRSAGSERLGDVQYHSNQGLSLIENVLEEAWEDPRLAAVLRVSRSDPHTVTGPGQRDTADDTDASPLIPIHYHGRDHFAFVRPIANTPWSVVAIYDRTESLGLFAQTVAQTFFLCCLWVLACMVTCWLAPRALRLTVPRNGNGEPSGAHAAPLLRARSLWFFPNRLFTETSDGFCYTFERRADDAVLLLLTLGVQTASLVLLRPGAAIAVICAASLVALVAHYLLIARPRGEHHPGAWRRIGIFATAVMFGLVIFYIITRHLPNWWIFFGAMVLIALFIAFTFLLDKGPDDPRAARALQNAFLNRALALLLVVVAVPTIGFLTLVYTENLKGYVGASLMTASERIAEQRRTLYADLRQRFVIDGETVHAVRLDRFGADHPGWFISGPSRELSGIFSLKVTGQTQPDKNPERPEPANLLGSLTNAITPHYASANSEAREGAGQVRELPDAKRRFVLMRPQPFEPIHSGFGTGLEGRQLVAGPIEPFPLHPDARGWLGAVLFLGVFLWLYYRLLRKAAAHLTGLNLDPVKPSPEAVERLDALIEDSPEQAWAKLDSDEERARLLALAYSRTINFRDRTVIRKLVEEGYLELTPYVRIANDKLTDYIRYDLPPATRAAITRVAHSERDQWDRMRLPVFGLLTGGVVLFAYSSPSAVQLVVSAFLAMTALLPFARDPLARIFEAPKK